MAKFMYFSRNDKARAKYLDACSKSSNGTCNIEKGENLTAHQRIALDSYISTNQTFILQFACYYRIIHDF